MRCRLYFGDRDVAGRIEHVDYLVIVDNSIVAVVTKTQPAITGITSFHIMGESLATLSKTESGVPSLVITGA